MSTKKTLTKKQKRYLTVIKKFYKKHYSFPTLLEIIDLLDGTPRDTSTVNRVLDRIVEKGHLLKAEDYISIYLIHWKKGRPVRKHTFFTTPYNLPDEKNN